MVEEPKVKKILFAEDSRVKLRVLLTVLKNYGFNLDGKSEERIIYETMRNRLIFRFQSVEVHLTSHVLSVEEALCKNIYDSCFLDRSLYGGYSYGCVKPTVSANDHTEIFLISSEKDSQNDVWNECRQEHRKRIYRCSKREGMRELIKVLGLPARAPFRSAISARLQKSVGPI